jgi:hypothetical protein
MKVTKKAQRLLEKIAQVETMERGKICKLSGRKQFNHQTWHEGRNRVRYVRPEEVEQLQRDIDGYARFVKLMEQYADEIIRSSREKRRKQQNTNGHKNAQIRNN